MKRMVAMMLSLMLSLAAVSAFAQMEDNGNGGGLSAMAAPLFTVSGPIRVISSNNAAWGEGEAYISRQKSGTNSYKNFDPILTLEFDFNVTELSNWGQFIFYFDNRSFSPQVGYQIRLTGNDSAWNSSGQKLDVEKYGIGIYKGNKGKGGSDWLYVAGTSFNGLKMRTDYTMRVERVIDDVNTTVKIWIKEKGMTMGRPLLTYAVPKADWAALPGAKFTSWDRTNVTVTNLRAYNVQLPTVEEAENPEEEITEEKKKDSAAPRVYPESKDWFSQRPDIPEYDYSFALIGDTQTVTRHYTDQLACIYDWIVENAAEKKMACVLGLGDITDGDRPREWTAAKEQIAKMDGVVPYTLCRGNHDSSNFYNDAFGAGAYAASLEGLYSKDQIDNAWRTVEAGGLKYLIMVLDYGAVDEVLQWADQVIAAHPDHNVIITTHAYLDWDGTVLEAGDPVAASLNGAWLNDGDEMWDKLIRKHENIVLVISGHISTDDVVVTQTPGDHGNIVTQMLIDPQDLDARIGATGMVAMMYLRDGGSQATVEYYSTVRNQYFKQKNQFELTLHVVK
ncbi:MAG: hypothetical protein E7324_00125 [Clostridiales bacterium]|nr:hypothetical protein [Clostridiales bacterium]